MNAARHTSRSALRRRLPKPDGADRAGHRYRKTEAPIRVHVSNVFNDFGWAKAAAAATAAIRRGGRR